MRSSLNRAVWARALAGDTVLCSWARQFTLAVPLGKGEFNVGGNLAIDYHSIHAL